MPLIPIAAISLIETFTVVAASIGDAVAGAIIGGLFLTINSLLTWYLTTRKIEDREDHNDESPREKKEVRQDNSDNPARNRTLGRRRPRV